MQITRRMLLGGLGAGVLVAGPTRLLARQTLSLGDIEVTTVSDGHLVLPGQFLFPDLPEDELDSILSQHGVSRDAVQPPCNVTLMRARGRTVLFDAGSGDGFMPSAGRLRDALGAIGIMPEDVTDVVLTHGHPDHLWGVLDDFDDPMFANASYLMGQREFDYWSDPDTVDSIGPERAAFAVGAARRLEAIAEHCTFFGDAEELLPGVMAHATFGHTPGHMGFEIRQGSEAVLVAGDAIGNHHVAFARPDWRSGADQDRDMGAATRLRLLDMLAQDQTMLIGFHLPDGGIGRVERSGDAYRFVPAL
ncbi:MBL fold metallo-hydrolase [Sulfitobacter sabulilitoris]|uniref:MBL fold metallo-hydrolase n=1 Tax=Sulfitobacter sabulilitoris TaxID=2562655 RepID=A0A5S3PHP0_9RHOB|nr:MBL fold metallo-hydrolase [Sulfitobacter sabulilitoris]TMM52851.1 MBL fold metallo-hydrolase [Sulfitobacter sabulilitoris]